jgi:vacuolar-type H+-ATPase subunit F/Vma7
MSRVAVIGAGPRVGGYALAGALVIVAEQPARVRAAWRDLPDDVALVVLTAGAAAALAGDLGDRALPLVAVMPP